jgi:hypothetical protein
MSNSQPLLSTLAAGIGAVLGQCWGEGHIPLLLAVVSYFTVAGWLVGWLVGCCSATGQCTALVAAACWMLRSHVLCTNPLEHCSCQGPNRAKLWEM